MGEVAVVTAIAGDERKKKFFSVLSNEETATGIACDASPVSYEANEAFIVIANAITRGESTNGNVIVVPQTVKLTNTAVGTNGIDTRIVWAVDVIDRWSSGGTSLTTLAANTYVDTYSDFSLVTTCAQIHAGDLILADASDDNFLGASIFRTSIGTVNAILGDQFSTHFGGDGAGGAQVGASSLGTIKVHDYQQEVYLGPGTCLVGHMVCKAMSAAASFLVEAQWTELHHDYNA